MDDSQPVGADVTTGPPNGRRMPEAVAVHGGRPVPGGAAVADRDDGALEDLPF
jgi:hypothetical protein